MKIKITRTGALILTVIFMAILVAGGMLGFRYWREHLAIGLSATETYTIDGADLTDVIQYATMSNAFSLSFIFTMYGIMCGFMVDTAILALYTVIKLIINNGSYFEAKKEARRRINAEAEKIQEEKDRMKEERKEASDNNKNKNKKKKKK